MHGIYRLTCLWPGLPRLWFHADPVGLLQAAIFAVLLNVTLWLTFVVRQELPPWGLWGLWMLVSSVWMVWVVRAVRAGSSGWSAGGPQNLQDLFIQAQSEYLKGRWAEAGSLLERLIRADGADVESRLLMASVLRRSGRLEQARSELQRVTRLEGGEKWHGEILREQRMLDRRSVESP